MFRGGTIDQATRRDHAYGRPLRSSGGFRLVFVIVEEQVGCVLHCLAQFLSLLAVDPVGAMVEGGELERGQHNAIAELDR